MCVRVAHELDEGVHALDIAAEREGIDHCDAPRGVLGAGKLGPQSGCGLRHGIVLKRATGELAYANAGHNLPYRLRADGSVAVLPASPGLVLALAEEFEFRTEVVRLEPGDGVFLFTDGVTEAIDAGNVLFSEDRLEAYLRTTAGRDAAGIVRGAIRAVDEFAGGAPQFDDITALAIRYCAS